MYIYGGLLHTSSTPVFSDFLLLNNCSCCYQLRNAKRFLRDRAEEPFVAILDPKVQLPTVLWREHTNPSSISLVLLALKVLHSLARQWDCTDYVLVYGSSSDHWFCRIELQNCPDLSLTARQVLDPKLYISPENDPLGTKGEQTNE